MIKIHRLLTTSGCLLFLFPSFSEAGNSSSDSTAAFVVTAMRNIRLSGFTQVAYQHYEEKGRNDKFEIRRARLDLKGVVSPSFDYHMHVEFNGPVRLLDAVLIYKSGTGISVQAGQFKVPMSLENNTADNKLDFINRTQVVEALVARGADVIGNHNGRDIGLQVSGAFFKANELNHLEVFLGIFNGQGINTADLNDAKDVVGRLIIQPLAGLKFGGSIYAGYGNYGYFQENRLRNRYAGEIQYRYRRFLFQAEYIAGEDGSVQRQGYYGFVSYFVIPSRLQVLGRYDFYDQVKSAIGDATYWVTPGINYFFNEHAKIQLNYEIRFEESIQYLNNLLCAQLQLSF